MRPVPVQGAPFQPLRGCGFCLFSLGLGHRRRPPHHRPLLPSFSCQEGPNCFFDFGLVFGYLRYSVCKGD